MRRRGSPEDDNGNAFASANKTRRVHARQLQLPHRRLAASGRLCGFRRKHRALDGICPHHGARQDGHAVHRRQRGHLRRQQAGFAELQGRGREIRAADDARRPVGPDEAPRSRCNPAHHLHRPLHRRAHVRVDRSFERRPRRLEFRHRGKPRRRAQLQPRQPHGAWRALRPRRGIRRRGARPVGQFRGRRVRARQGLGALPRPEQNAHPQPQGPALLGARPAEQRPLAAGPAGDRAGGVVRARQAAHGAHRRRHVHRAGLVRAGARRSTPT